MSGQICSSCLLRVELQGGSPYRAAAFGKVYLTVKNMLTRAIRNRLCFPLRCLVVRGELGTAGGCKGHIESRAVVDLPAGDIVYTKCFVIYLGHRDEHSSAGKKRHEFNKHSSSFSWY